MASKRRGAVSYVELDPFGAEVDLDLAGTLDDAAVAELVELFRRYGLLSFARQRLTAERQVEVSRFFGTVPADSVTVVSSDPAVGHNGTMRLAYHSDQAYARLPDRGVSLHAVDLVGGRSTTTFADARRACARLAGELRDRLRGRTALQVWPLDQTRRNRAADLQDSDPRYEHPVVWTHPDTGEEFLYVTEMQTDRIVGLDDAESEAVLAQLFAALYAPDNLLTHVWQPGDFCIWDNLVVQHGRPDVSDAGTRTLRRTVLAELGFFEQFPQFRPQADGMIDSRHSASA